MKLSQLYFVPKPLAEIRKRYSYKKAPCGLIQKNDKNSEKMRKVLVDNMSKICKQDHCPRISDKSPGFDFREANYSAVFLTVLVLQK